MAITGSAKFRSVVADFAVTARELGYPVQEHLVAAELQQRITSAALAIGVSEQSVLRTYVDDSWGRDMARQVCSEVSSAADARAVRILHPPPAGQLTVLAASSVIAALGLALQYFACNEERLDSDSGFNINEAGAAVFVLAQTVGAAQGAMADIQGHILALARDNIEAFHRCLLQQRWAHPGRLNDNGDLESEALAVVSRSLDLLRRAGSGPWSQNPGGVN